MIREITKNDKNEYIKMAEEFYRSDAVSHGIPKEYFINAFNEAVKGSPFIKLYILEQEGIIAGYAAAAVTFTTEGGGKTLWIDELYIKEQFRGRGLGRGVVKFFQSDKSVKRIRLEVTPENERAKHLYKSEGFKECEYRQMIFNNI